MTHWFDFFWLATVLSWAVHDGAALVLSAWSGPVTGREPRATWRPVSFALRVTVLVGLVMP